MMKFGHILRLKYLPLVAALALCAAGDGAWAKDAESRQALVNTMSNAVLSVLKDQRTQAHDRISNLERGFADMVDTAWIAKFVLGNAWRSATEEQRQRYTKLYGRYLAYIYISNYAENSDRKIRDIKMVGINGDGDSRFTARTEVQFSNDTSIRVDYLVDERPHSNKIIDVVIEGVSLLQTHRSEFGKLAADKGVDGVIAALERLVSETDPAQVASLR